MQCVLEHTAHYCTVCIMQQRYPAWFLRNTTVWLENVTGDAILFHHFPLFDETLRHVELCNSVNSQIQQNPPKQCDYSNPRENYSVFSIDFHFPLLTYAEIIARLAKYHSNKATFKAGPSSVKFLKGQVHEIFFLQVSNPSGSFFHML